jgi:hypothetical protein
MTTTAHEMGHGYGLQHAEDTAHDHNCGGFSSPSNPYGYGDYCDYWDVMGNGASFVNPIFDSQGRSGPALNARHLDYLGWMPAAARLVYDPSQTQPITVLLSALGHNDGPGFLEVAIPPWDSSSSSTGYTVEFRNSTGWDQGMNPSVMVHAGWSPDGSAETFIEDNTSRPPQWYNDPTACGAASGCTPGSYFLDVTNNVQITVDSIDGSTSTAIITVARAWWAGGGGAGGSGGVANGGGGGGVGGGANGAGHRHALE